MPLSFAPSRPLRLAQARRQVRDALVLPGALLAPAALTRTQASSARSTSLARDGVTWQEHVADVPRFHGRRRPLLVEPGRTNGLRNPRGVHSGALPTHWTVVTAAGMTTTRVSSQVIDGVETTTINCAGTASGTTYLLGLDTTTGIVCAPSDLYAFSFFGRFDTSPAPPSSYRTRVQARTSGGSAVAGQQFTVAQPFTGALRRMTQTGQFSSDGTIARILPMIDILLVSGQAYDFTFTIGWPQVELAAYATTPILPAPATVALSTRGADLISCPIADAAFSVEAHVAVLGSGTAQTIWQADNGTNDNAVRCYVSAGGSLTAGRVTAGAAVDATALGSRTLGEPLSVAVSRATDGAVTALARGQTAQTAAGAPTSGLTTLRIGSRVGGTEPAALEVEQVRIAYAARTTLQLPAVVRPLGSPMSAEPIRAIFAYGQSRAANASGGVDVCVTAMRAAQQPDLALMMDGPASPGLPFERPYETRWTTRFRPLVDCGPPDTWIADVGGSDTTLAFGGTQPLGQSAGSMLYRMVAMDRAANLPVRRWLYGALGVGGRNISQLVKGAAAWAGSNGTFVIYDRAISAITQANTVATTIYGVPLVVEAILWAQGEADGLLGTDPATYKSSLATLAANITSDVQAITGQAAAPRFVADLVPPSGDGLGATIPIAQAQADAVLEDVTGRLFSIGPVYQHPFASASHMSPEGVVAWAEQWANALHPLITQGVAPTWLRPGTITVSSNVITVPTINAQGDLVLDTTTLPLAPAHGFVLTGTAALITDVAVSGSTVTITCDASPAGGTLGYADTLSGGNNSGATGYAGAYGNVRDASGAPSVLMPGVTIRRFLQSFRRAL